MERSANRRPMASDEYHGACLDFAARGAIRFGTHHKQRKRKVPLLPRRRSPGCPVENFADGQNGRALVSKPTAEPDSSEINFPALALAGGHSTRRESRVPLIAVADARSRSKQDSDSDPGHLLLGGLQQRESEQTESRTSECARFGRAFP